MLMKLATSRPPNQTPVSQLKQSNSRITLNPLIKRLCCLLFSKQTHRTDCQQTKQRSLASSLTGAALLVQLFAEFVSHRLFAYLVLYLGALESFGVRGNCGAVLCLDVMGHSVILRSAIVLNLVELLVEIILIQYRVYKTQYLVAKWCPTQLV
jgi:hypothetical protein